MSVDGPITDPKSMLAQVLYVTTTGQHAGGWMPAMHVVDPFSWDGLDYEADEALETLVSLGLVDKRVHMTTHPDGSQIPDVFFRASLKGRDESAHLCRALLVDRFRTWGSVDDVLPEWTESAKCGEFCGWPQFTPDTKKQHCRACPVRSECLDSALQNGFEGDIWGGLDDSERAKLDADTATDTSVQGVLL